jgi:hypothetical protein
LIRSRRADAIPILTGTSMSHLRPEDLAAAAKRSCRRGRHWYGDAVHIGGGIWRQVCLACGAVSIDITGATESEESPGEVSRHDGLGNPTGNRASSP